MSGLTGLVDTLLAGKLSPRLELLALQTSVSTDAAAGPVAQVQRVENDVRLPSQAALDRQLAAGAEAVPGAPPLPGAAQSPAAQLSVAARVISAVLADLHADAAPVRGAAPMWPSSRTPSAAVLAGTLAQNVSGSGLFYEAHLLQFATGNRTLAQLAEEPQARWSVPVLPKALEQVLPTVSPRSAPDLPADSQESGEPASARAAAPDAARVQAAYRRVEAGAAGTVLETAPVHRAGDAVRQADGVAAPGLSVVEVIHPQAVTVVHQQLDLLATAVFRWNGQAWPGVPMEWSIQEEGADQHADAPAEDRPRRWSTTVSLSLPRLGAVDLRLSLTGPSVQAHLVASETATLARLRTDGGELAQRLEAAGLRLQELQITAIEQP